MFKTSELLKQLDKQGFTNLYLYQLKYILKKFQSYLDKNSIIEPSFQNFWDFLLTLRGSNKDRFLSKIFL